MTFESSSISSGRISSIQTLPSDVVHLMAAGEVIDSLAAVVRELAENALDAKATRISIELDPDSWRIRVVDNGCGMALEDLQQAALPHSTSKIRDRQDLIRISSLGFRGEALHSLAQLSHLSLYSRLNLDVRTDPPEEPSLLIENGYCIQYDRHGQPIEQDTVAIAPGTITVVDQLFGNWLTRRQSLPSLAQQFRAVQLTVQHLALCHPAVTWRVSRNSQDWFSIYPSSSSRDILPQLVRSIDAADLREGWRDVAEGRLYTLIGLPDRCHRRRPDWVKVAINGRVVRSPELEQSIMAAFRQTLPRDRHPVCFVHLYVAGDAIDWNRHPAKTEIYLRPLDQWQNHIQEAIAHSLSLNPSSAPDVLYTGQITGRVNQLLKTAEAAEQYDPSGLPLSRAERLSSLEEEDDEADQETLEPLTPLKAIAQVHNTYILVEHPSGMWLVEQHIAHERVIYEQLCDRWTVVPLESPVILNHLMEEQVEQLQRLSLDVEAFGDSAWAIRTIPQALVERGDRDDALIELSLGGNLDVAIVATACRTAIRNGTPLEISQMQTLISQWQRTRHPRTCPHGRPIYLALEESRLSRFFRRHWVIGKSHGI
ncbi:MAG: DNA mismatch repair endonuclease MutL [Elainellaceae cyanobacterium]